MRPLPLPLPLPSLPSSLPTIFSNSNSTFTFPKPKSMEPAPPLSQLHFVLVPLLAQGHIIPMIDIAKLLAEHGVTASIVTTPCNTPRFAKTIHRARAAGLHIHLIELPFPCEEVGLPPGCENLDSVPSPHLIRPFYRALDMLRAPLEQYLADHHPPPSCVISDRCLPWTSATAERFRVPRVVFHGMCCFSLLTSHNVKLHRPHLAVGSDSEPFLIPGMPLRVEITRAQLPGSFVAWADLDDIRDEMQQAESNAYGVVVNSFPELEGGCAEEYRSAINKKVWCIGPVSPCNRDAADKFERGNAASIGEMECLKWLDSKEAESVIYACLGSQCRLVAGQLVEMGLGLEASKQAFIWVISSRYEEVEVERWLEEERFEERVRGRGLVIRGWAPQLLILSHRATGGFLTHCGWNSTIEGVCAGVGMVTWPMFAEQFLNEKLIVDVLGIGVRVGVELPVRWGDEDKVGVLVTREQVEKAVVMLMEGQGQGQGEGVRKRGRELGEVAMNKMESAHLNISLLIQDIFDQSLITSTFH